MSVIRRYPAAHAQRGFWFLHELAPESAAYNVMSTWMIRSRVDVHALRAAWTGVTDRNDALRTTYRMVDGVLMAEVRDAANALVLVDAAGWTFEKLLRQVSDEAHRPFDLERGPVSRAMLFTASPEDHVLLISGHHIAGDGWSNRILMKELGAYYDAHGTASPPALRAAGPSCREFAQWQAGLLEGPEGERLWSYWRERLAGELPVLDLPADRSRRPVRRHRGASETVTLDGELASALRRLASSHGTTPFVVLLSAFQALLARYTGQNDIVVGSTTHGRTLPRFRRTFGNLMNQVVLRADLSGMPSFTDHVRQTRETVHAALTHQAYPFPLLVERLAPVRVAGRPALCDVTFNLTYLIGEGRTALHWDRLSLTALPVARQASQNDLDVQLVESDHGLTAVFQYDSDLFDPATIQRMARHYTTLLAAFAAEPDQCVWDGALLTAGEPAAVLVEPNRTEGNRLGPAFVHALVETQAARAPEATAVSCEGEHLSYRTLDERANQLAHRLRRLGVRCGTPVAIYMERSLDLVVGLLSVLKAGGAYVPLDPASPQDRLAFMIEDAGARVLITDDHLRPLLPGVTIPVLALDGQHGALQHEPVTRLADTDGRSPDDRAYIIYTSGSTGRPKGVEVSHRALTHVVLDVGERLELGPGDTWAAIINIAFDPASLEVWGTLAAGARLEMVRREVASDGRQLGAALHSAKVSVLAGTPTMWRMLLTAGWPGQPGLKMLTGGEVLTRELADELLQRGAALWNMYGPTEAAIYVTVGRVSPGHEPISIGRPISNVRLYVLDRRAQPVPVGIPGELWIGGLQVALGYVNRPEETVRVFQADPDTSGHRRYRTGDLVRYRQDGRLEYLGRCDEQVKVRGHRVEIGEIEVALQSHPGLQEAAVLALMDAHGDRTLRAYLVAKSHQPPPTAGALRLFLERRLPAYMIPAEFALLDKLPVTPRGKVDRRVLAAVTGTPLERNAPITPPRTGLEETVARIWAGVLERAPLDVHDNFFDLGGHSLLATLVTSRIQETLQVSLAVRDLFEAPTVAGLAERIATRIHDGFSAPTAAIEPRGRAGAAQLSFSQERMWFLHQLAPESAAYNVPAALRIRGEINIDALVAALREIVRRHEILRAVFPVVDGRPVQVVTDRLLELPLVDLQTVPGETREARARDLCRDEARRPFDLERGPILRALLIRLDPIDHVILLNMHHIVSDQWSFRILGHELIALYDAHCAGRPLRLPPLRLQFADFASWQREWLSGPALDVQLAYWRRHLGGPLPVLDLPADRPRPAAPTYEGGWERRHLTSTLVTAVEALSRQEQASVFMTLMAGFSALLARYAGQDEFLLGVPIANRNHPASEDLIGDLVNTLPLRLDLSDNPTFREHLRDVRSTLLDAYAHQDMPFDKLVLELQPKRYSSHSPLVQVLINLLNVPMPRGSLTDLGWEPFLFDRGAAQFDLTLTVDWGREPWISLEYSADLFDHSTAARIVDHFEMLLRAAVAEPDRRLSEISLLAGSDREQLLVAWNCTAAPVDTDISIEGLFEAQAERTPDAVAIMDPEDSLTYRELDRRANQLARHLQGLGVGHETAVGVCLVRSCAAFVAVLAVLKSGGMFVPLDPAYPAEHVAYMLADSRATVVVTAEPQVPAAVPAGRVVLLDADREAIGRHNDTRLPEVAGGDRAAYVIYTSGSTGAPKGVVGLHRGAVNRFRWMWRTYPFRSAEVCCQKTSTSFVDSIWETFGPLLQGVPVVAIPDDVVRDPKRLIHMLAEHRVTRIVLVPSLLRTMLEVAPALGAHLPHLRLWVSSGEALGRDLVRCFREAVPRGILLNLYGSSEVAGDSTFHEVGDVDALATIPIGRPIDNTEIYILDGRREPVPIGVTGELFIGGAGLARGYLNRPELTAERFVPNPFSSEPGARMYRTGDRARYRSDGVIEYLGRLDSQVKVRGFRIELGEVESALASHPGVAKAVAVARADSTGDCRLMGYVVPTNGAQPTEILEFVRRRVPGYMVPSSLALLDALPLTPSGKVDRRSLPEPGTIRRSAPELPRTATEATLAAVWAALLEVPEVGVHDDFFELGGHSLLAAQLMARVERIFRTTLPLRSLFEAPTVARLAALIEAPSLVTVPQGLLTQEGDRVEIEL